MNWHDMTNNLNVSQHDGCTIAAQGIQTVIRTLMWPDKRCAAFDGLRSKFTTSSYFAPGGLTSQDVCSMVHWHCQTLERTLLFEYRQQEAARGDFGRVDVFEAADLSADFLDVQRVIRQVYDTQTLCSSRIHVL